MDYTPNYATYSYNELVDAYNNIDAEKYPERFQQLKEYIDNFHERQQQQTKAEDNKFAYQEHIDPFDFRGNTKEFFSIWIVNVFLTIVTLGIYSAWAKVRTTTYFYSNTFLDESSFRYHAQPLQILRGRLIAVVLFIAYYASGYISTTALFVTIGVIAIAMPAFIVMSLAFKMRNSSYRNVHFTFAKDFRKAYTIFAVPFLAFAITIILNIQFQEQMMDANQEVSSFDVFLGMLPFLLFLLFPAFEYFLLQYRVNQSGFGTERFNFDSKIRSLYGIYVPGFFLFMIAAFGMMFLIGVLTSLFSSDSDGGAPSIYAVWIMMIPMAIVYLGFFAYIQTKRTNLVYNSTSIAGHQIHSELSVTDMFGLYLTNTLGIMVSLGLLVPWAMIRTAKYKLSKITIISEDRISEFVAGQSKDQSAIGEEIGDLFDIGIGV